MSHYVMEINEGDEEIMLLMLTSYFHCGPPFLPVVRLGMNSRYGGMGAYYIGVSMRHRGPTV